jgi:hypothetical protein
LELVGQVRHGSGGSLSHFLPDEVTACPQARNSRKALS